MASPGRGFRSVPERLGFETDDEIDEYASRNKDITSDGDEYTPYGAPNVLHNAEVRQFWRERFYWTFTTLAVLWGACFIIQAVLYATSDHFDACVVITHDMPRSNPTVLTEHVIGRPHIFFFTVFVAVVMFLLYTAFVFYTRLFRVWYMAHVIFDQATHKYIFSSFAWAFMTLVIAVVVGVSDIFLLIIMSIMACVAQGTLAFMEFWNANRYKTYDNMVFTVGNVLGLPQDWHHGHPQIWALRPVVDWAPFLLAFACHVVNAVVILTNYGFGVVNSAGYPHWWVTGAVSVYIIVMFLAMLYMVGSWMHWPVFTWYVWMEFTHHVFLFCAFNLMTFLVLGGSGGNQYDATRGCLYPAA
jgi:hypothetical protein